MSETQSTFGKALPVISEQVRSWRQAQGMTQAELEEKAGLSHNTVSRIECDSVSPRLGTLDRLAASLNVSVEQLQFQKPEIQLKEKTSEFDGNKLFNELTVMLLKVPEPKKSRLLRTFMDLIRIALEEDDA